MKGRASFESALRCEERPRATRSSGELLRAPLVWSAAIRGGDRLAKVVIIFFRMSKQLLSH